MIENMDKYMEVLSYEYFGNTVLQYVIAASVFILSFIVLRIVKRVVIARLVKLSKRTKILLMMRL